MCSRQVGRCYIVQIFYVSARIGIIYWIWISRAKCVTGLLILRILFKINGKDYLMNM